MPQFETTFYISQIVWILISFFILYLIIHSVLFPMLSDTIKDREHQIEDFLAQAEHLNMLAQENEKIYERALLDAQEQASHIAFATQEKINALKKRNTAFIQKTTRHTFEIAERQLEKEHALLLQKKARLIHQLTDNLALSFTGEEK